MYLPTAKNQPKRIWAVIMDKVADATYRFREIPGPPLNPRRHCRRLVWSWRTR